MRIRNFYWKSLCEFICIYICISCIQVWTVQKKWKGKKGDELCGYVYKFGLLFLFFCAAAAAALKSKRKKKRIFFFCVYVCMFLCALFSVDYRTEFCMNCVSQGEFVLFEIRPYFHCVWVEYWSGANYWYWNFSFQFKKNNINICIAFCVEEFLFPVEDVFCVYGISRRYLIIWLGCINRNRRIYC